MGVSEEKEGAYVFTACSVNAAERDGGTNNDVLSSTRYTMPTASRREEVYSGSLNPPRDGGGGGRGGAKREVNLGDPCTGPVVAANDGIMSLLPGIVCPAFPTPGPPGLSL